MLQDLIKILITANSFFGQSLEMHDSFSVTGIVLERSIGIFGIKKPFGAGSLPECF